MPTSERGTRILRSKWGGIWDGLGARHGEMQLRVFEEHTVALGCCCSTASGDQRGGMAAFGTKTPAGAACWGIGHAEAEHGFM